MNHLKEIICFLILFSPYVWEVLNDRYGDLDKKLDVALRIAIDTVASIVCWYFTGHSLFAAGLMCFAIFFLLFDYTIAAILVKNKVIRPSQWFSYMGESGDIDNIPWWRNMNPWWRFAIRFSVFAVTLIIYF